MSFSLTPSVTISIQFCTQAISVLSDINLTDEQRVNLKNNLQDMTENMILKAIENSTNEIISSDSEENKNNSISESSNVSEKINLNKSYIQVAVNNQEIADIEQQQITLSSDLPMTPVTAKKNNNKKIISMIKKIQKNQNSFTSECNPTEGKTCNRMYCTYFHDNKEYSDAYDLFEFLKKYEKNNNDNNENNVFFCYHNSIGSCNYEDECTKAHDIGNLISAEILFKVYK
jgi:hypothetical protein